MGLYVKKILIFCMLVSQTLISKLPVTMCKNKLFIVESNGNSRYHYRNLILMSEVAGFDVYYKSLYDFLENDHISLYDAIFFIPSLTLLKNHTHEISTKFIRAMVNFAQQPDKLVGILMPTLAQGNIQLTLLMQALLEQIGLNRAKKSTMQLLQHMLQGDSNYGTLYGTTLINKNEKSTFKKFGTAIAPDFVLMPSHKPNTLAQQLFPSAVFIKNKSKKNSFFVSTLSTFCCADIEENFFKNPLDFDQRTDVLRNAQSILCELFSRFNAHDSLVYISKHGPELPKCLSTEYIEDTKESSHKKLMEIIVENNNYAWIAQQGISAAWLEPQDYFLAEDKAEHDKQPVQTLDEIERIKKQALEQGINFIYEAGFNLLWFEFNPELFLANNAAFKDKKEQFIKHTTALAHALKKCFANNKKPLPKVFVGTDITTNYGHKSVGCATQDVFGTTYTKIPCPLDFKGFWKSELLDVFDTFYATFIDILPVDGVFFDFEMYHASGQAASYTNLMDFSDNAWSFYCTWANMCPLEHSTVSQRVAYLTKHKAFADYFALLQEQARLLGKRIKEHIKKHNPTIILGAYAATLPTSWFYRGLLAGLSSRDEPLIYATFNTDYYSHSDWLEQNNIFLIHGAPLLLSKFKNSLDFGLIPYVRRFHDFVWFNRPSRMVYEKRANRWWSSEASLLNSRDVAQEIKKNEYIKKD